ncbi:Aim17p [Sugiyamaella lignohabitans]|uniref:Aim17p n=1 Tax=Sugiyamaella lignohabitans TaxID=796027 RepID=A0A167EUC8_9ASCO|nr:Aim17p [Sugiyamaella lignohabitans]ANB14465.1 Aim17p [Sugiyamaella lignohabitans]
MIRGSRLLLRRQLARKYHVESFDKSGISLGGFRTAEPVKFRNLFLRDACASTESVDVSTKQKTFSTAQLGDSIYAKNVTVNPSTQSLDVEWADGHKSSYSQDFLETYSNTVSRRRYRHLDLHDTNIWNSGTSKFTYDDAYSTSYKAYLESPNDLVKSLQRDGIAFITDIPPGEKFNSSKITVEHIAEQIGPIKNTFYGPSWNVISQSMAKNVAYTAVYLPLHMDLLYFESPPGVQLLHVIENNTIGGESIFADSFAAALHILETDPDAYSALTEVPISYHYVNDNQHYYFARPLIVEDVNSSVDEKTGRRAISHINYSPPFQGPIDAIATTHDVADNVVTNFYRGLRLFEEYIENPSNQIEVKMAENTCVLFMNRRTLHGRQQFQPGSGNRWFKGTYLDIDSFQSKLRTSKS